MLLLYNYHHWIYLNMPECAWINRILNMPRLLNIPNFQIWQGFQYASVTKHSENARICLDRVLNISWVLDARIKDSEYGRVLNMQELHRVLDMSQYGCVRVNRTWICLNMSEFKIIDRVLNMYHTRHGARSLYMLMSTYWETGVFRTRSKI